MRASGAVWLAILLGGCVPPAAERGTDIASYPPTRDPAPQEQSRDVAGTPFTAPAQRPVWEAARVEPDAATIAGTHVTVQPGDTLRGIADRTGSASQAIARANGLAPPYVVRVGQVLEVPGGRYHLVRAGQSGIGIARAYGVPWADIVAANQLSEPYILRTGQRLLIPGGTRAISPAQRAAAFRLDIDTILTGGEPAIPENARPAPPSRIARPIARTQAVAPPTRFAGGFDWPAYGPIVAHFGGGTNGVKNNGIKIGVPLDTPVKAAADGTVAYVGDGVPGLGGVVMVLHGSGWVSVYGHASRVLVSRGQAVHQGETIARSGDSGFADRPELHFELRHDRVPVDPLTELPAR